MLSKMGLPRRNIRNRDLSIPLGKKQTQTWSYEVSYWSLWSTDNRVACSYPKGQNWIMVVVSKRHFSTTGKNIFSSMKEHRIIASESHLCWRRSLRSLSSILLWHNLRSYLPYLRSDPNYRTMDGLERDTWEVRFEMKMSLSLKKGCSATKCINHGQRKEKARRKLVA